MGDMADYYSDYGCDPYDTRSGEFQGDDRRSKMKIENIELKVVGVTFDNENGTSRQEILRSMSKNSPIVLKREPFNRYDSNAVAVLYVDQQVGYIGKEYAKIMAPMMDKGTQFTAKISKLDSYDGKHYLHILVSEGGDK